jgi:hypothetical protein
MVDGLDDRLVGVLPESSCRDCGLLMGNQLESIRSRGSSINASESVGNSVAEGVEGEGAEAARGG